MTRFDHLPSHAQAEARAHGCAGKVAYDTRRHALLVRKQLAHNQSLKAYHCPCCDLWHLGHSSKRGTKRQKTRAAMRKEPRL